MPDPQLQSVISHNNERNWVLELERFKHVLAAKLRSCEYDHWSSPGDNVKSWDWIVKIMTDLKRSWKTDQEWMYKVDYSFQLWLYFEKFESYLGTRIYRQSAFRLWFLMSPSAVRETICVQSSETQAMYWHRPQALFQDSIPARCLWTWYMTQRVIQPNFGTAHPHLFFCRKNEK